MSSSTDNINSATVPALLRPPHFWAYRGDRISRSTVDEVRISSCRGRVKTCYLHGNEHVRRVFE